MNQYTQTEIRSHLRKYQCFNLHSHYIEHINIEESKMKGSFLYPYFSTLNDLVCKITQVFPKIKWNHIKEMGMGKNKERITFGGLKSECGILIFVIQSEGGRVFSPIHISIKLTDFPFKEVKKLCNEYHWLLFHVNSFQYLEPSIFNETESNLFSN